MEALQALVQKEMLEPVPGLVAQAETVATLEFTAEVVQVVEEEPNMLVVAPLWVYLVGLRIDSLTLCWPTRIHPLTTTGRGYLVRGALVGPTVATLVVEAQGIVMVVLEDLWAAEVALR